MFELFPSDESVQKIYSWYLDYTQEHFAKGKFIYWKYWENEEKETFSPEFLREGTSEYLGDNSLYTCPISPPGLKKQKFLKVPVAIVDKINSPEPVVLPEVPDKTCKAVFTRLCTQPGEFTFTIKDGIKKENPRLLSLGHFSESWLDSIRFVQSNSNTCTKPNFYLRISNIKVSQMDLDSIFEDEYHKVEDEITEIKDQFAKEGKSASEKALYSSAQVARVDHDLMVSFKKFKNSISLSNKECVEFLLKSYFEIETDSFSDANKCLAKRISKRIKSLILLYKACFASDDPETYVGKLATIFNTLLQKCVSVIEK